MVEERVESAGQRGLQFLARMFVPILQMTTLFFVCFVVAVISSYAIYTSLLPKALISEPVYFDFSSQPPVARVNLLSEEKQWYYLKGEGGGGMATPSQQQNTPSRLSGLGGSAGGRGRGTGSVGTEGSSSSGVGFSNEEELPVYHDRRYLKSGSRYMLNADFVLAKSPRNFEAGKFMLHTSLMDTNGELIAKSSRPVVLPYESYITLILNVLAWFPLRLLGFISGSETSKVQVHIMNDFKEPPLNVPATEFVEMTLSTAMVDVENVYLHIMPVLKGLTYYVYHYPLLFCATTITVLTMAQLGIILFILLVSSSCMLVFFFPSNTSLYIFVQIFLLFSFLGHCESLHEILRGMILWRRRMKCKADDTVEEGGFDASVVLLLFRLRRPLHHLPPDHLYRDHFHKCRKLVHKRVMETKTKEIGSKGGEKRSARGVKKWEKEERIRINLTKASQKHGCDDERHIGRKLHQEICYFLQPHRAERQIDRFSDSLEDFSVV